MSNLIRQTTTLVVDQVRDTTYEHLLFEDLPVGIEYDQTGTAVITSRDEFNDIIIKRPTIAGIRIGHSQMGNVDLATWRRIAVGGDWSTPAGDGFLIEYVQAKVHRLYDCSFGALKHGLHIKSPADPAGGNFYAWGTNFALNEADLCIEAIGGDGVELDGFYSEQSSRLLVTGDVNTWCDAPITLGPGRWCTDKLHPDGRAIIYNYRGPLNLIGVKFTTNILAGQNAQPSFQIACHPESVVTAIGCVFPNLNPIPVGKVTMLGCLGWDGHQFVKLPNKTVG